MRKLRERPIQIYLRPDQDAALRALAKQENVAIAELVRRGVDQYLAHVPVEQDPLMRIVGIGASSGAADLSENHDKYLLEIYENESKRWQTKSLSTRARGSQSRSKRTTTIKRRHKSIRKS